MNCSIFYSKLSWNIWSCRFLWRKNTKKWIFDSFRKIYNCGKNMQEILFCIIFQIIWFLEQQAIQSTSVCRLSNPDTLLQFHGILSNRLTVYRVTPLDPQDNTHSPSINFAINTEHLAVTIQSSLRTEDFNKTSLRISKFNTETNRNYLTRRLK